jgi:hypothetical protein
MDENVKVVPVVPEEEQDLMQLAKQSISNVKTSYTPLFDESSLSTLAGEGITVGKLGDKLIRQPIEKYKASTQKTDRIALISQEHLTVKYHYIEGVGYLACISSLNSDGVISRNAVCCQMSDVQVRHLYPIAIYTTDNDGNIVGKKIEVRVLVVSADLAKNLENIHRANHQMGGIEAVDLLVTCTDDKYQKLNISSAGEALWKKNEKIQEGILEKIKEVFIYAPSVVARKVDEATFRKLVGLEDVPADNAGGLVGTGMKGFDPNKSKDLASFFAD